MSGPSTDRTVPLETIPLHSENFLTLLDQNGRIQYVSPAIERILEYDQSELIGDHITENMHPNDCERATKLFDELAAGRESAVKSVEYRYKRAGGSYVRLRSVGSTESTADGHYVINTTAISALNAREQHPSDTNERLNEFAKVVSHDLRNPLSVASGHVQLLHEEFENDLESERERLEKVIHAHDRMEALIQDLLTLAQSGTQIRETKWIDFSALCETCWENVSTADATLEINVDGQIRADPSRLKQLMENLIRNAVDHGGDTVTVTIGDIDDRSGFYVADDGVGIEEAKRDRIFESGFSTVANGTGFGLAIVSEVVDAHGWEIDVAESSDGGARFEISGVECQKRGE
jgi:PAS domain S-box-containing protein